MIKYYYKTLKDEHLKEIDKYKSGSWVFVENPKEDDIEELVKKFDLDSGLLYDALDVDEVPRLERSNQYTYVYARFASANDGMEVTTQPALFIIGEKILISVSRSPMPRLGNIFSGKVEDITTTQPTKLFLQLMDQLVDHYESRLNIISRRISSVRSRLKVEEVGNKDFITFVGIEDGLNEFLAALSPMNSIFRRILLGKHVSLLEEDEELLEDLLLNNQQSIEACKSNLKSIVNIREAYSTIMSNNLNRVIRILTVFTVVISVPTLVASLYGMNVDLPFQDKSYAFFLVLFMSFFLSGMTLFLLRLKKWF